MTELLTGVATELAVADLQHAIATLTARMQANLPLLRLGVALVDAGRPWLRVLEVGGEPAGPASQAGGRMPLTGTANGRVVESGEPWLNPALDTETARHLEERRLWEDGARAYFCFPCRFGGRVVGTLNVALRERPVDTDGLVECLGTVALLLGSAIERHRLGAEVQRLAGALRRRSDALAADLDRYGELRPVANSVAFRRVMHDVERIAVSDGTVLLQGPTGSGKEVLARFLHASSPRAEGPFVAVNSSTFPDGLAESMLFGHRRGAFTGAERDAPGLFEQAANGTLFLDEVGELPLAMQAKLLRVVQERSITPVGSATAIPIDVRVVAATNRDLAAMVTTGEFRGDLYYRLIAFPVEVPGLDRRREDVPELVERFLECACARMQRPVPTVPPGVMQALIERDYPGNVRELRNLVERALCFSGERLVLPAEEVPAVGGGAIGAGGDAWLTLEQVQARHITRTLERTGGKFYGPGGAAELLAVNPSTLKSRMARLGVVPETPR